MYQRILVATDGSIGAETALKQAVALQKICHSELLILSVYRHYSLLESSLSMVRPQEPDNMDDSLKQYAQEIAEASKQYAQQQGVDPVRAFVRNGHPARTIVQFAKDKAVDLIVIGSRGVGDREG